jgi:predicted RNA-binding protein with RPS1 domain
MSTEEVAEAAADVPVEVAAMDGVDSEEEAHNAERPARGSGIHKHKKGGKAGIPLSELEVGSTVEGTVKGTTSYGAFLDIGSQTDALLHVSRMSDDFVANVEDVVKKGDVVSVRIVSVDLEKKQVAVTMRSEEAENRPARSEGGSRRKDRPRRSTGDREAQRATLDALAAAGYDSDKFIEGEVVSQLDFGAFVRFDASQLDETVSGELDGLVHISALSVGRTENVSDVVSIGDKVQVRVKNVDAQGGKVSLSMIAAADEPAPRAPRADSADKPKRRARSMFTEAEMGASDWKESVETILGDQPSFANMPIIVDKRN